MLTCKTRERLMGSDFELIVCAPDREKGEEWLAAGLAEIRRLEALLTEFSDHSDTGRINSHAGQAPVAVAPEVYQLIERCLHLSSLTQGAFDITAGALKGLYDFKRGTATLPDRKKRAEVLGRTGYRHLKLPGPNQVFLDKQGARIGFGAIGKGYAADAVRKLWQGLGVSSGVVNASGDLTAWGNQADGRPWKIGIANPAQPEEVLLWLPVADTSVATSGNYEQYFDIDGTRYSHNIDPRTGWPARLLKSVTIVSPSAELSDALATAVTIMGISVGLDLVNQLPQVHAIIIDEHDQVFTSQKIKTYA